METLEGLDYCVSLQELYCNGNKFDYLEFLKFSKNIRKSDIMKNIDITLDDNKLKNMTVLELNKYYIVLNKYVDNIINVNYDNFIKCNYFTDNKKQIVEKYKLVEFYKDIYTIIRFTDKNCYICYNVITNDYVKCINNHEICRECYDCLVNNKICCVCRMEYEINQLYYKVK